MVHLFIIDEPMLVRHNHSKVHRLHKGSLLVIHILWVWTNNVKTCIHQNSIIKSIFIALKILHVLPVNLLFPLPLATSDLFVVS